MTFDIDFSQEAKKDVSEIYAWHENIRSGLGKRFRIDLKQATSFLRTKPDGIQIRYADLRIIFLKKFTYGVHYRIRKNTVKVMAVLHTKRKPRFRD